MMTVSLLNADLKKEGDGREAFNTLSSLLAGGAQVMQKAYMWDIRLSMSGEALSYVSAHCCI